MMITTSWVSFAAVLLLISVPMVAPGDPPPMTIGMPNCTSTCGNVSVPYPFGMGPASCYHSPGFKLTCDHGSRSPRLLLGDGHAGTFEVVDFFLENATFRVISHGLEAINMSGDSGRWSLAETTGKVPYFLHGGFNEFILWGCDIQATLVRKGRIVSGCVSFCTVHDDGSGTTFYYRGSSSSVCSNIGCCQSSIIAGSESYRVDIQRINVSNSNDTVWYTAALIAEVGWLEIKNLESLAFNERRKVQDELKVPVILGWAVPLPRNATTRSICKSTNSKRNDKNDSMSFLLADPPTGYSCQCKKGYQGNPYLTGGCQDIKECDQKETYGCFGDCKELPGSFLCRCPEGTHGNHTRPDGCVKSAEGQNLGLIIGLSVASGPCLLILVLGAILVSRDFKQRKEMKLRRKFFHRNRGKLLKQLVSHRADIAERMIISLEELEKATNNFDHARRLDGGGHGTVYKGILSDLHVVAIKKSKIVLQREITEFINEVAILSQINHRNIVKLHGCCLETEVPLLAYEFISNGTLSDHLHTMTPKSLPWKDRLRITSEISKALAYLRSAISVPIIHRDIKPSNILLDDALTVKVSDFGASRYIPVDQTGVTTAVQGTIGYLDPMYYYTGRLTESSDVYSFGVLLVELLTRQRPSLCMSSEGEMIVTQFVTRLENDNLAEILDPQVLEEGGSEVETVANLAVSCMKLVAEERPTMRQIDMALEALQAPKENVMVDLREENNDNPYSIPDYPSTTKRTNGGEGTRCYSLEEEFMSSTRYPR